MNTYEKIYNLVKKIPSGKVSTYGQIGQILNLNPRVVGWALNGLAKYKTNCNSGMLQRATTAYKQNIPWQRIINSKGRISTNKLMNIPLGLQKVLLKSEGIKFDSKETIDLKKYLWRQKKVKAVK